MGLTLDEMDQLEEGMIIDMIIEAANDHEDWPELATQADIDKLFM